MNMQEQMKQGRQTAVKMLWGMAGSADPIDMPADQRASVAANLRHIATLIEQAPEHVAGLVFISAERTKGDHEGDRRQPSHPRGARRAGHARDAAAHDGTGSGRRRDWRSGPSVTLPSGFEAWLEVVGFIIHAVQVTS